MRNLGKSLGVLATLGVACVASAQPANDACTSAAVVGLGTTPWDNTGATTDGSASCGFGGNTGNADIWYSFTPGATGLYTITTCGGGSINDTLLSVHDSCGGSELACNDDFCGLLSSLTTTLNAGTAYLIRVAEWSNTPINGTGNLDISVPPPGPANDFCSAAIPIALNTPTSVDNTSATEDGPAATCAFGGSPAFSDIWYSFTSGSAGCYAFSTCGGTLDTVVTVLDGCGGSELGCDDDACGFAMGSTARAVLGASQTVLIRVAGWGTADEGATMLEVTQGTTPANDSCATPAVLTVGSTPFDNGCTSTDGSASCGFGGDTGGADIWYSFTPASSGLYRFDTCNSFDTMLSIHDTCGGSELACNDDYCGLSSQLDYSMTGGTTYLLRVAGWDGTQGSGTLNLQGPLAAPANDLCASATVVTVGSTPIDNNFSGTEGSASCGFGGDPGFADVFYSFTAPATASYRIETCGSPFDTILNVLDGCGGSELACNDDACGLQSRVVIAATASTNYIIRLSGYAGAQGTGTMTITEVVPLPNDTCATATTVALGTTPIDTTAANNDAGTSCGGGGASPDIFFTFTPAETGAYQFDTCGSGYDTVLAILDACGGSELACNDDFCGLQTTITTNLTAATSYIVQVDGYAGASSGTGVLNITFLGGGGGGDYTVCESANAFESISATGTLAATISGCDDCFENVPIGFDFEFFGSDFNTVNASSNGLVAFGTGSAVYVNQPIPNSAAPNNFAAAIWDDMNPFSQGDVYYQTAGSAGNRTFTVSWEGVTQFGATTNENFQVVLHESGNIVEFRYGSISADGGGDYTIGVENALGTSGTSINSADIGSGSTARYLVPTGTSCPSSCDTIDFNGDGLLPDVQDISDFIFVFGGGTCPTGTCGDVDFNNDGLLPDVVDIQALISVFAGGPCIR